MQVKRMSGSGALNAPRDSEAFMSSAPIIPFPTRAATRNELTIQDKIDVCLWERALDSPELCRVVIHDQVDTDCDEVGLILAYGPDSPWARWGLARRGNHILLWQCSRGLELGLFQTMRSALAALEYYALMHRKAHAPAATTPADRTEHPQ
jgi:hypothetical protein